MGSVTWMLVKSGGQGALGACPTAPATGSSLGTARPDRAGGSDMLIEVVLDAFFASFSTTGRTGYIGLVAGRPPTVVRASGGGGRRRGSRHLSFPLALGGRFLSCDRRRWLFGRARLLLGRVVQLLWGRECW